LRVLRFVPEKELPRKLGGGSSPGANNMNSRG
jgi:hypothetical protein